MTTASIAWWLRVGAGGAAGRRLLDCVPSLLASRLALQGAPEPIPFTINGALEIAQLRSHRANVGLDAIETYGIASLPQRGTELPRDAFARLVRRGTRRLVVVPMVRQLFAEVANALTKRPAQVAEEGH